MARRDQKLVYRIGESVYRANPGLFHTVQRHYNKVFSDKKWGYRDPNVTPPLRNLNIEVSIICNLRCPFCWWWGEKGIAFQLVKEKDPIVSKQLSLGEIKNVIDQAAEMGVKELYLSGGEPFIRPDTLDIIKYATEKDLFVGLVTNGTLIKDNDLRELAKIRKLSMTFSIDGTREVHDKIRGPGMFDKTVETIRKLKEYKGDERYPAIRTNTTFSPWLLGHTVELATFLSSLGLTAMHFQHLWFTNKEKAEAHKRFLQSTFGAEGNGADERGVDSHIITMPSQIYAQDLAKEIDQLERTRFDSMLFVKPQMTREQIIKYYTDINFSVRKNCVAPWEQAIIKAGGDVVFCPDEWVTHNVGNIREKSLKDLWASEQTKHFRQTLNKVGLFPACNKCCFIN